MKKSLKITGWILLILVTIIFLLVLSNRNTQNDNIGGDLLEENLKSAPTPTETPSLEEMAGNSLKTLEDLIPEPTKVPSLEEQAELEGKDPLEFVPKPTNVAPLED